MTRTSRPRHRGGGGSLPEGKRKKGLCVVTNALLGEGGEDLIKNERGADEAVWQRVQSGGVQVLILLSWKDVGVGDRKRSPLVARSGVP